MELPPISFTACGALQIAKALSQVHVYNINKFSFIVKRYQVANFVELVSDYSQFLDMNLISSGLDFSVIGDDGVEELVEFLHDDSVIHKLHLCENDISDIGAKLLGDVLHYNSTVTYLDLSSNDIGDTGAEALAQALHSNTKLEELILSETNIGDDGVKALAQALCHGSSLKSLHLNKNLEISEQAVHCLIRALTVNTSITISGSSKGLVLDQVECQHFAYKCSEYCKVKHKIEFV